MVWSGDLATCLQSVNTSIQSQASPTASTATITNSPAVTTLTQVIVAANPARKGLVIYNNSANSIYLSYGPTANSNTLCTRVLATFTQFDMPAPIYTGVISGIRNAGTGFCVVTELT